MGLYLNKQNLNDYNIYHNIDKNEKNWSNLIRIRNEYFQERMVMHRIMQELFRIDATNDDSHPFITVASTVIDKMILERYVGVYILYI